MQGKWNHFSTLWCEVIPKCFVSSSLYLKFVPSNFFLYLKLICNHFSVPRLLFLFQNARKENGVTYFGTLLVWSDSHMFCIKFFSLTKIQSLLTSLYLKLIPNHFSVSRFSCIFLYLLFYPIFCIYVVPTSFSLYLLCVSCIQFFFPNSP